MLKLIGNIVFSLTIMILLAGCTNDEQNKKEVQEKESSPKIVEKLSSSIFDSSVRTDVTSISNGKTSESTTTDSSVVVTNGVAEYNKLPLEIKIQLMATLVDDRAKPIGNAGLNEHGLYIYYGAYDDYVLINVHSGVGTGHPIYLINYDTDSVTPAEGVVAAGASNSEIVGNINTNPVSKASLYEIYLSNQEAYDNSINRVQAQDFISIENFNLKKEQAEQ